MHSHERLLVIIIILFFFANEVYRTNTKPVRYGPQVDLRTLTQFQ